MNKTNQPVNIQIKLIVTALRVSKAENMLT